MKKTSGKAGRKAARTKSHNAGAPLRVVFSEKQIRDRIRAIANDINRDYRGKTPTVVCVLENGFMFMADLVRHLKVPAVCRFIKAEVQDKQEGNTPVREIRYTPRVEAAGRDILLVDTILQSGVTQDHLYRYLVGQNARSVRSATLIEKTDERKMAVNTDYVGFKTRSKFLVGYGLAHQDQYRNLPFVAALRSAEKG